MVRRINETPSLFGHAEMMAIPRKQQGFTLVELSIVLVVIGLIVGGVLVGRDLISHAQVRTVIKEVEAYEASINAFRGKYGGLPGDLRNAFDFFGTGCAATSVLCNGNGDGQLNNTGVREDFKAWQQLALAGMIAGQYSGTTGTYAFNVDLPQSKIGNAGYYFNFGTAFAIPTTAMQVNTIVFGMPVAGTVPFAPAMTSPEGFGIDTKMDDGLPTTGIVLGRNATNCASSATPRRYREVPGPTCTMMFVLQ